MELSADLREELILVLTKKHPLLARREILGLGGEG